MALMKGNWTSIMLYLKFNVWGSFLRWNRKSKSYPTLLSSVAKETAGSSLTAKKKKKGKILKFLIKCLIFKCLFKVSRYTDFFTLQITIKIFLCKNRWNIFLAIDEEIKQNISLLYIPPFSSQHKLDYFLGLKYWSRVIEVWKGHL